MKTVTRIFSPDLSRVAPAIEEGVTIEQLYNENAGGYEDFADIVWIECEGRGFYNDSDPSSDVLCIYVKGE